MKRQPILLLIFMAAVTLVASCSIMPVGGKKDLLDTSWNLVSYGNNNPLPGTKMTLNFSGNEIQGSASCNHYFGSYRIKGNMIIIDGLGWTEMACLDPEGIMNQEQEIMSLLSKAESYVLQGNQLIISTDGGESMIFQKMIE